MSFHSWLHYLRSVVTPSGAKRKRRGLLAAAKHRLHFEPLEDRRLLAFLAPVDYAVGLEPSEVATGDFNNDGQPDLATTNYGDGTVSVLLGNADGTFQPPLTSTAGTFPLSLAVGHFNADDSLDLVVTTYDSYGDNDINILLGNGDGEFAPAASLSIPWWFVPMSVSTGDMNADGIADLVVVADDVEYGYGGSVNVLLGQGNGNFEPAVAYGAYAGQYSSRALALADFNGDGNTDVVVAGSLRTVKVHLGYGDGTLGTARDFGADFAARSIAVGDFNADGKLDLAVTDGNDYGSPGVSDVNILLGTGTGAFQTAQSFAAGTVPVAVRTGDVNGDGVLDLVVTNVEGLAILLGTGGGSFGSPITIAGSHGDSVLLADFNGDSRLDAAATNADSNRVSVLLNGGDGTPPPPSPSVSVGDVTVSEGNSAAKAASFVVTLSAASIQPVIVAYATANGTAVASSDYQAAIGALTIPAGQTAGMITVLVNGDRVAEANETFVVNLSSPVGATIADGQAIGTIMDDEPRISISDASKKEGKKGQTPLFTFTVTLSTAYDQTVTMSYRTVNGTATTGDSDYIAKIGTLTFAPGETTKTVTIEVKGDNKREGNETFYLDLFGNSSNSQFTKNRGIGTILNDD